VDWQMITDVSKEIDATLFYSTARRSSRLFPNFRFVYETTRRQSPEDNILNRHNNDNFMPFKTQNKMHFILDNGRNM
jgi:hypothetical protein